MAILELKNINCGYNSKIILKNISLTINEGEFVSILGPNGCGKTTLLRAIDNIIPISGGQILLNKKNLNELDRKKISQAISYVPQLSEPVAGFSVEEIIQMARAPYYNIFSNESVEDLKAVEDAMINTDLFEYKNIDVSALSGGQYQRVLIARALAQGSDVLLLDEPTAHLDIKYQIDIMSLIKNLKNKTIVSTFHDLNLAKKYSQRVVLMKNGTIFADGNSKDVLTDSIINEVFDLC